MANSDKNIVITPNISSTTADPKIVFSGADASTTAQNITLQAYPTNSGTLSFEGSAGQLFSISNTMTGTIYSVNDVSGIPSIEVLDTGLVKIAQYSGNLLIGTGIDSGIAKVQITGDQTVSGKTIYGPNTTWGAYLQVGGNSREYVDNATYASVVTSDGNLHLDASSGHSLYLNYYDGGTVYFGNGANSTVGNINSSGAMTLNGGITAASLNLSGTFVGTTAQFNSYVTTSGPYYRSAAGGGYLNGQYGTYESTATSGPIYSIGGSYVPGSTTLGNMYGVGYTYSQVAGNPGGTPSSLWGLYGASSGTARWFLDTDGGRGYFVGHLYSNNGSLVVNIGNISAYAPTTGKMMVLCR